MAFDPQKPYNDLPLLPPASEVESARVLKKAIGANKALAELRSISRLLPNHDVLINNITLLEAKDSTGIENIFTTHDQLHEADILREKEWSAATKEVLQYRRALWHGVRRIEEKPLGLNIFIEIAQKKKATPRASAPRPAPRS